MKRIVKMNENDLSRLISESVYGVIKELNEGGGYDMSTPEGRRGAFDWMRYVMDQEDRRPAIAAQNWAEENGLDGDENIIKAFIAGVEYGRDL